MTKLFPFLFAAAIAGTCSRDLPYPIEQFETPDGDAVSVAMISAAVLLIARSDMMIL